MGRTPLGRSVAPGPAMAQQTKKLPGWLQRLIERQPVPFHANGMIGLPARAAEKTEKRSRRAA